MTFINDDERRRFWDKVLVGDDCWNWTGALRKGYGAFRASGHTWGAHRLAYAIWHGLVPERGAHVCHKCDNPQCVRPDHLFLGTAKDNALDSTLKGRHRRSAPKPWTRERLAAARSHNPVWRSHA